MDETVLQVLHEPNKPATSKSYMWVMVGSQEDGHRIVLYHYSPHHSAKIAESLLEGYRGTLQTDAYSAYDSVGTWPGIWHVGCMLHSRRKFYEAYIGANKQGLAKVGLQFIKDLYRVEHRLRAENLPDNTFVVERRKAAAPILRRFKRWLKVTKGTVPDESLLGKAISYTLDEFKRLVRYLRYAYLTPDNNVAERAIKPYVVGRKNWLFNNTPLGAHASAAMYSLVETAIANKLDPYHFLWRLLTELPEADTREKLEKLLPWNIEGIPPYKTLTGNN
jgi:transposase